MHPVRAPGRPGPPIRLRLTAVFAAAVGIALVLIGVLVYLVFRQGVDARIDEELADRQGQVVLLARDDPRPARIVARAGEPLMQVYDRDGAVAAASPATGTARLLGAAEALRAARAPLTLTRDRFPGLGDGVRVRAFALPDGRVAAIGEPRDDRRRTLDRLAAILLLALPLALIAASIAGYRVARAALRPVEAMRSQAAAIGTGDLSRRLATPGTRDELDRLAATLNDLLARLEGAVERERRIVADASHELRTPVSVLLTRLDVALLQDLDRDALHAVVAEAREDARRLARLAGDLLVLARADGGGLPIRQAPVEVHDLMLAAVRRNVHAAAGRHLRITGEIAGGAVVIADPDRAAQMLDNLIANAVDHGAGEIEIRARLRDGQAEIAVRDHGPGFPPEMLPRVFDRFAQAGGAGRGSGLGLAIVAALAAAQNGTVRAANDPDGGAVTAITFPVA